MKQRTIDYIFLLAVCIGFFIFWHLTFNVSNTSDVELDNPLFTEMNDFCIDQGFEKITDQDSYKGLFGYKIECDYNTRFDVDRRFVCTSYDKWADCESYEYYFEKIKEIDAIEAKDGGKE